jgi:superfamily I DNA/RNA helicase
MVVGRVAVVASPRDVSEMIEEARDRRTYELGRERFRTRLADRLATQVVEASRAGRALDHDTVLSAVRGAKEYQRLVTRCWPRQTPEALVAALFKNRRRLAAAGGDLLTAQEIDLLLSTSPAATRADMTHSEFALLDEARGLIDPELRTYGHVVVDEAQNLSPMELRMVVRRARRQSMTMLGDIAQRTAEARLSTWESVLRDAGVDELAIEELLVSYRVPDDFLRIAATLAPDAAVPEGVREAPWPAVSVRTSSGALGTVAAALAERMAADVGSVGVVTPESARSVDDAAFAGRTHAEDSDSGISTGVNLHAVDAIKGLEFDAAIVVEPQAILDRPPGGRGGLYTALTRSTRALAVVHAAPLPFSAPDLVPVDDRDAASAWASRRRTSTEL